MMTNWFLLSVRFFFALRCPWNLWSLCFANVSVDAGPAQCCVVGLWWFGPWGSAAELPKICQRRPPPTWTQRCVHRFGWFHICGSKSFEAVSRYESLGEDASDTPQTHHRHTTETPQTHHRRTTDAPQPHSLTPDPADPGRSPEIAG